MTRDQFLQAIGPYIGAPVNSEYRDVFDALDVCVDHLRSEQRKLALAEFLMKKVRFDPDDVEPPPKKRTRRRRRDPGSFKFVWEGRQESCTNQRGAIVRAMHQIEVLDNRSSGRKHWIPTSRIIRQVSGSDAVQVSARLKSARDHGLVVTRGPRGRTEHALLDKGRHVGGLGGAVQAARGATK